MNMLNINGKPDSNYRYKMPPIKCSISGKGNGIQTTINNIADVCKYLNQPPIIILKFLSSFYGAILIEDKLTITGSYTEDELQKALQVYINKFIICPKCGVPEIIPMIKKESKKSSQLEAKCSSCGTLSTIGCNSKIESKTAEIIIKYLEKNEWSVNKGILVKNEKSSSSGSSSNGDNELKQDLDEEEINPFG